MPSSRGTPKDPLPSLISSFRGFNRMYTRLIGTLDEGYHHTPFSLADVRVIYELATRTHSTATDIAASLALDPGYLSRILRKLESAKLLKRQINKEDNRSAELKLTAKGHAIFRKVNTLSEKQARSIIAPLPATEQTQLIESMKAIEKILSPAPETSNKPQAIVIRSHRPGDMGWVVELEGRAYTEEYGWDSSSKPSSPVSSPTSSTTSTPSASVAGSPSKTAAALATFSSSNIPTIPPSPSSASSSSTRAPAA